MNPTRSLLLLTAVVLLLNSCTDEITPPEKPNYKHPREMTWKADTLEMPDWAIQLLPMDLLVLSPTEAWLTAWIGHGQIYKYNGEDWTLVEDIGGGIDCLTGRTKDEIWAGGYIGRDINGQYAQDVYLSKNENEKWVIADIKMRGHILDMSTDPKGRIWACGYYGLVMKYENGKWLADTIEVDKDPNTNFGLGGIEFHNNKCFVIGTAYNPVLRRNIHYYFTGDLNNWTKVDSFALQIPGSIVKWGTQGLTTDSKGNLYSYGLRGVWKYENSKWEKILAHDGQIFGMAAFTEEYLLAFGPFRKIYYYNNKTENWENISDLFPEADQLFAFKRGWTNGEEIIVTGYSGEGWSEKTIIWHGK